jgi:hypothetical protein
MIAFLSHLHNDVWLDIYDLVEKVLDIMDIAPGSSNHQTAAIPIVDGGIFYFPIFRNLMSTKDNPTLTQHDSGSS